MHTYIRKSKRSLIIAGALFSFFLGISVFVFSYYTQSSQNKPQNTAAQAPQGELVEENIDPQIQVVFDTNDLLLEAKVISFDHLSGTMVVLPILDSNEVSLTVDESTVIFQQPNNPSDEFKLYPIAELKENMLVLVYGKTLNEIAKGLGVRIVPQITPNSQYMHHLP